MDAGEPPRASCASPSVRVVYFPDPALHADLLALLVERRHAGAAMWPGGAGW